VRFLKGDDLGLKSSNAMVKRRGVVLRAVDSLGFWHMLDTGEIRWVGAQRTGNGMTAGGSRQDIKAARGIA
jgi:hypothetical protein